jgi:hypothetical protein
VSAAVLANLFPFLFWLAQPKKKNPQVRAARSAPLDFPRSIHPVAGPPKRMMADADRGIP